jgi:hypothetical protein
MLHEPPKNTKMSYRYFGETSPPNLIGLRIVVGGFRRQPSADHQPSPREGKNGKRTLKNKLFTNEGQVKLIGVQTVQVASELQSAEPFRSAKNTRSAEASYVGMSKKKKKLHSMSI